MGADFAFFSGHKAFAPMGIGFLYGRRSLLDKMPPFLWGGEMITTVGERSARPAQLPQKFEAGTPNAAGAFALVEALRYIDGIGYDWIIEHEQTLTRLLLDGLKAIPRIKIYGNQQCAEDRCGIVSFNCINVSPAAVSDYLDNNGIAVRAGSHCALPLMGFLGITASCRASLSIYNTESDVELLLEKLRDFSWSGHQA